MIRGLLGRLSRWISREDENDRADGDDEADVSGFVPSRLDASVLEAHGMSTAPAERELAQLQEKANQLEQQQRDDERQQ